MIGLKWLLMEMSRGERGGGWGGEGKGGKDEMDEAGKDERKMMLSCKG